jgi:hypothetical protein
MPIAVVACQARGFQHQDQSHFAQTDRGDQPTGSRCGAWPYSPIAPDPHQSPRWRLLATPVPSRVLSDDTAAPCFPDDAAPGPGPIVEHSRRPGVPGGDAGSWSCSFPCSFPSTRRCATSINNATRASCCGNSAGGGDRSSGRPAPVGAGKVHGVGRNLGWSCLGRCSPGKTQRVTSSARAVIITPSCRWRWGQTDRGGSGPAPAGPPVRAGAPRTCRPRG